MCSLLQMYLYGWVMASPAPTNHFSEHEKIEKNSKQQNNKKISLLTGHHHKPLSYRVTIFLTRYAHLHKLGFEPPTSSLARTFFITTLVTVQGMLLFYINSEIDLQGWVTPSPVPTNDL